MSTSIFQRAAAGAGAAIIGLMGLQAATAADLSFKPSIEPEPYYYHDWSGFHVGAFVAHNWSRTTVEIDPKGKGFTGGFLMGWNHQIGDFVIGVEGDYAIGDVTGSNEGIRTRFRHLSTIRGRLGYAFDTVLLYGTAGLALSDIQIETEDDGKDNQLVAGYVVGGGVEWAMTDSLSLRAEYLYTGWPKTWFDLNSDAVRANFHEFHTVRGALTYTLPPLY